MLTQHRRDRQFAVFERRRVAALLPSEQMSVAPQERLDGKCTGIDFEHPFLVQQRFAAGARSPDHRPVALLVREIARIQPRRRIGCDPGEKLIGRRRELERLHVQFTDRHTTAACGGDEAKTHVAREYLGKIDVITTTVASGEAAHLVPRSRIGRSLDHVGPRVVLFILLDDETALFICVVEIQQQRRARVRRCAAPTGIGAAVHRGGRRGS